MNKRIKAPVIRFIGFSDNWKQSTFGDLAEKFEYGLNASATKYDGENKYIRITDIDDVTHKFLSDNVTSPDTDLLSADNFLLNDGDILFARTGASVGKSYQYDNRDGKLYFAGFLIRARISSDNDTNFVFQNTLTSNYKKFVKITSQRSGQPGINAQEFRMFKIMVPGIEEQTKIGTFFKQLDNIIALQQQLLNDHKQLKKAMLQKMFPQKGESVPRVRFANFTDDWEQLKLSDISEKITKKNRKRKYTETLTNSAEHGIISQSDYFDKTISNIKNIDGYYIVEPDNFVYNPRISNFAPVGPIKRNNLKKIGVMSPLYYVFKIHDVDPSFLENYFDTSYWHEFMKLNGDSGARADRFAIKDSVFKELPIPYTNINEQEKIGNFFKQLDETIVLYEQKLETYQELKKAMLQKMFV